MENESLWNSLAEVLRLGGPAVGLLLLMSVATLAVTIYKLWQSRPGPYPPRTWSRSGQACGNPAWKMS